MVAYQGLAIVPSILVSSFHNPSRHQWKKDFKAFENFYSDDFPSYEVLDGEIDAWERFWLTYEKAIPNSVVSTLKAIKAFSHAFPNILVALKLLATLPITSCECERSFSAMKNLKNCKRSTMGDERLNGLALMQIHQEIVPDVEDVIDLFADMGKRRIEFL